MCLKIFPSPGLIFGPLRYADEDLTIVGPVLFIFFLQVMFVFGGPYSFMPGCLLWVVLLFPHLSLKFSSIFFTLIEIASVSDNKKDSSGAIKADLIFLLLPHQCPFK